MYTVIAVSVAFLTVLAHCGISYSQTGIERVPAPNGSLCSDILMYTCVTTGLGAAEFNVSSSFLRIRHSQYPKGTPDETVRNSSDYIVMAGNLLKSDSNDSCCDTVCDFCYTAELTIPVTEETMCQSITCGTLGDNGTTSFRAALVERVPRSPYNLSVVDQSTKGFTAVWMPEIADCPSAMFEVATTDCGSCNSTIIATNNNITCEGLTANRVCRVSVRSVSECGSHSEPVVMTVEPLNDDTGQNVAIAAGVSFTVFVIIVGPTVVIIIILFLCRKKISARFAPKSPTGSQQQIALQVVEPLNNGPDLEVPQQAESSLNGTNHRECPKKPEPEEGSTVTVETDSDAVQPTQVSPEERGVKETDKLIVTKNAVKLESQPKSASNRGMEQLEIASEYKLFSGPMEDEPSANEPSVRERDVVESKKKSKSPGGGPRSKSPNPNYSLGDEGMIRLITQAEHDSDSEEVKPKEAVGPSQPASASGEDKSETSKMSIVREGEGPYQHVAPIRNYTSATATDPMIRDLQQRVGNLESGCHGRDERINQLEIDHQKEIKTLNEEISKLKQQLSDMQVKCANLEKLNQTQRIQYEERIEQLQAKITQLEAKLAESEAKVKHYEASK